MRRIIDDLPIDVAFVGKLPIDFVDGEVFADGLRNEVGLAFDSHGILWGVENGADKLVREDIGGDVHNDNPAVQFCVINKPRGVLVNTGLTCQSQSSFAHTSICMTGLTPNQTPPSTIRCPLGCRKS